MLRIGFDDATTIPRSSGSVSAAISPDAGAALSAPSLKDANRDWLGAAAHEIFLKG